MQVEPSANKVEQVQGQMMASFIGLVFQLTYAAMFLKIIQQ